jgi:hypothetical protein
VSLEVDAVQSGVLTKSDVVKNVMGIRLFFIATERSLDARIGCVITREVGEYDIHSYPPRWAGTQGGIEEGVNSLMGLLFHNSV